MNILGLGHVGLKTDDLDKTMNFYCGLLGFKLVTDNAALNDTVKSYFITRGNLTLEIMYDTRGNSEPGLDGSLDHLSMETDDVDAAYAELQAAGVPIETEILFDPALYRAGQRFFMFRGPSGERLQIEQNL